MAKNHMKRLGMPTTWTTHEKKSVTWVARVKPGAHPIEEGMPLVLLFREMLSIGTTRREVRNILYHQDVLVDGTRRKDHRFNIGLMDVLSIPMLKQSYRISLNTNGKLVPIAIDEKESKEKICKIKGKTLCKGKIQLTLSDGRTLMVDKGNYKTSDSVVISVPDQKIVSHIAFEKGALVLITGGKQTGEIGTIEEIKATTVLIKSKKETFETSKKYCFVVGKQKPALTIHHE